MRFPCDDGEAPTSCAIDAVTGVYQASYIRSTGDCAYEPGGPTPLEAGVVTVANDACSLTATEVSGDRCNVQYSIGCEDGMGAVASWTYSVNQANADATVLEGTATLTLNQDATECASTYAVRFDLIP